MADSQDYGVQVSAIELERTASAGDFLQVVCFAAKGATYATLPDFREPANSPNHCALFHSLACGGAVTYGAFGKHTDRLHPDTAFTVQTMAVSYLSHLLWTE